MTFSPRSPLAVSAPFFCFPLRSALSLIPHACLARFRSIPTLFAVMRDVPLLAVRTLPPSPPHVRLPLSCSRSAVRVLRAIGNWLDSARADYLREASLIIWDELPMANVVAFDAVNSVLKSIMNCGDSFGGKTVIAIGDFRQVAPVVKGGGPTACYMASVLSSPLWSLFQLHRLTAPIRNASDVEFADFVDDIGEDTTGARINLQPVLHHPTLLSDLQHHLFPDSILQDPAACMRRAFLTPLNVDVDKFNDEILNCLPGSRCRFSNSLASFDMY
jgi:hypothetical protein